MSIDLRNQEQIEEFIHLMILAHSIYKFLWYKVRQYVRHQILTFGIISNLQEMIYQIFAGHKRILWQYFFFGFLKKVESLHW